MSPRVSPPRLQVPPPHPQGAVQYSTSTSTYKCPLLTLKVHTEYGEAFFQSGPQLITQLVLFWTGVHTHDFQVTVLVLLYQL